MSSILKLTSVSLLCLCVALPTAWAQDGSDGGGGGGMNYAIANMETRLTSVEDQMRALTGKVEQVDFAIRRLDEALQRLQSDYDMRLSQLERAAQQAAAAPPPQPAPQPAAQQTEDTRPSVEVPGEEEQQQPPSEPVTGTLGGFKVRGNKVTGGVIDPKSPPLPKTPADYGLTPQEQYDKAFGLLRQADYENASTSFKRFIDKNPQDKLIDNAKYWYGETFYVRGKFGDAAVAFADSYQQNPKGTKAPDALLKLAMSLGSLEKKVDACGTLDALKAKYPKASPNILKRADQEYLRLKCKK